MTDDMIEVHPLKVRDREVKVFINARGSFHSTVDDKSYYGETRDALYDRVMVGLKRSKVKVAIPFMVVRRRFLSPEWQTTVRAGTVTGLHEGNANLLVEWAPGPNRYKPNEVVKEQVTFSHVEDIFRPLSAEEQAELLILTKAAEDSSKALFEFKKERVFNVQMAVQKAVDAEAAKA